MKIVVQIGVANADDHVYKFIEENNFNVFGIFIEPNPHSIPLIKNKYKNLKNKVISTVGISTETGIKDIYFDSMFLSGNSQHSSINMNHVIRHGHNSLNKFSVLCFSLNDYLNKIIGFDNSDVIDNLFIDTEGHDCDIILSTNFNLLNIKSIMFETTHSDGPFSGRNTNKFNKTDEHLKNFNYTDIHHNEGDSVYLKKEI